MIAEIKVKRDLRAYDVSFRDYWRTYGTMAVYVVAFGIFELELKVKVHPAVYFFAALLVVARAIQDSQAASNRRFGAIVELLEKRNLA